MTFPQTSEVIETIKFGTKAFYTVEYRITPEDHTVEQWSALNNDTSTHAKVFDTMFEAREAAIAFGREHWTDTRIVRMPAHD
jgi:hypothetical protein